MLVYSLGMTLYWSVDFHLPQNQVRAFIWNRSIRLSTITLQHISYYNDFSDFVPSQPVQLSDHLNSLLLSMCEDLAHRRVNLNSILEACESQHKASILPSPTKVIRQLVEEVFHESVSLDIHLQYVPVCKHFSFSAGSCVCVCQDLKAKYKLTLLQNIKVILNVSDFFPYRWTMALCQTVTFLWVAGAKWSERDFMVSRHVSPEKLECTEHIPFYWSSLWRLRIRYKLRNVFILFFLRAHAEIWLFLMLPTIGGISFRRTPLG